ncbi:MAG: nucleotidyltransferase family protein [Desulfomonilia bacterium]|jgi:dTDP-glucose pyrophosphorylase
MTEEMEKILIHRARNIREAMRQLEENKKRILFVVDDAGRLLGSLADGDIRRWILQEGSLSAPVETACNTSPFIVGEGYDSDLVREAMLDRDITCIPVVDSVRKVVDLLFREDVFEDGDHETPLRKIELPVVIMAGGKGTRLDPFTRVLPKPLIPIGDKTVLELIIETFLAYGVNLFYLSVNYKAAIIRSYFEELKPGYRIEYIEEQEPLGTAGSLRHLKGRTGGPLLVTNCDIIVKADYADLVDFHYDRGHDLTIVASTKSYHIPYGICEIENGGTLLRMVEKPEYSFLVNTGMYVMNPAVLDLIPKGEAIHATDLIERLRCEGGKVGVYPVSDHAWLDIGQWAEYHKVVKSFESS